MLIAKVISGGQTGADQAALRAAKGCGIPTGGYAPKGWKTETGPAPWLADYGLIQSLSADYKVRTRLCVAEADAMLWFGNPYSPGGKLTFHLCARHAIDTWTVMSQTLPRQIVEWIKSGIAVEPPIVLMVAGNRESKRPGIGKEVEAFLRIVFAE